MIYFLAEFCLNALNGTYFSSTAQLKTSDAIHARYAPFASIYILVFGFNTLNVSVIFSQILFLYAIFHSVDKTFINLLRGLIATDKQSLFTQIIFKVIANVPIIPLFVCINLNTAYITDSNKCNSLLSRILYTLSNHISTSIFDVFLFVRVCEFAISCVVNSLFLKFYLISQLKTSALIFAFSGTYFFLKTYSKSPAFSYLSSREFNFGFSVFKNPSKEDIESCFVFVILFSTSFVFQMLVRHISLTVSKKYKKE